VNDALLRLLIGQALQRRDDAAADAAGARRARDAAADTLGTLTGYRDASLARGPVRSGAPVGVAQLTTAAAFDARMIAAIRQQHRTHAERDLEAAARDAALLERQRRLKALETLERNRARSAVRIESRREQRALDEFATNLVARRRPGKER
jgi:flagellar FliJ protein